MDPDFHLPLLAPPYLHPSFSAQSRYEVSTDYRASFHGRGTPLILDNGSHSVKFGWGSEETPRYIFRSHVGRVRGRFGNAILQVAHDLPETDLDKSSTRSAFDRGVPYDIGRLQNVWDKGFSMLGIDTDGSIEHPFLVTEPILVPNYSRQAISELVFECYGAPSICYGIDSALSVSYEQQKHALSPSKYALVVSSGHACTHVYALIDGKIDFTNLFRINIGGGDSTRFLQQVLELKYPHFSYNLHTGTVERLKESLCYTSQFSYIDDLRGYQEVYKSEDAFRVEEFVTPFPMYEPRPPVAGEIVRVQLPYVAKDTKVSAEEVERREKIREQRRQRFREMFAQKRATKIQKLEERNSLLRHVFELKEELQGSDVRKFLREHGFDSSESLEKEIVLCDDELSRLKGEKEEETLSIDDLDAREARLGEQFPLTEIPESEVDESIAVERRKQLALRAMAVGRIRKKRQRLEKDLQEEEERKEDSRMRAENTETWLNARKEKRMLLEEKICRRTKRKVELTDRRSLANQLRLQAMAQASSSRENDEIEANFGARDEDWQVYKIIAKEAATSSDEDEDEETLRSKLEDLDDEISEYDPRWTSELRRLQLSRRNSVYGIGSTHVARREQESFQLQLGVERIRVPELIFQPHMMGVDQCGVVEALITIMNRFPRHIQTDMVKNIFITGGNSLFSGMKERITNELRCVCPVGATIGVYSSCGITSAWRGARQFASNAESFSLASFTRAEYDEMGPDRLHFSKRGYFHEHAFSNPFIQSLPPESIASSNNAVDVEFVGE